MSDPRAEIGKLWHQMSRELHDRFKQSFRDTDLPLMALILLRQIHEEPGVTISELARRSGTAKSHVSKMIDQLVQQGFLERRTDPADQRVLRVYMTQTAVNHKAAMEAKVQVLWTEVLAGLPQPDVEKVAAGLRILVGALDRSRESTNQE